MQKSKSIFNKKYDKKSNKEDVICMSEHERSFYFEVYLIFWNNLLCSITYDGTKNQQTPFQPNEPQNS